MLDPHTLAQQGWELEQQERYPEAIALYQKAWQLQPDSLWPEALNLLAIEAAEKQQPQIAEQLWQQAITQAPDYPEAHFNLGQVLIQKGENRGINYLKEAAALDPNWPEAHYQLGLQQCNQGQFAEAEASLKQAISLQPDWVDPYHTLGMVYYHQKLWQPATAAFQRAIDLGNSDATTYYHLGVAWLEQGQFAEAEASLKQAISLQPDWVTPYHTLSMTYYHQNLWQKTKELCLKMLSIQPEYSTAYFLLGQILFYTLNYDKAIAAYENFLSFSKSSSLREVALMNMAWAYQFYRDFDKSIELAQQIIDYDLNNIGTTITLVHSYFDKGEFTSAWSVGLEAIKTLELYLRNNPDREDIKFKLEHLKFCMQMIEHANSFLDKLNELAQEQVNLSIPSYIEIANAIKHQQAGNLKLATSHCLQALNLDPNNSLAHLDIGLIYESQGEVEMAINHWQKAILSNKKISSL